MTTLKVIAFLIIGLYLLVILLLIIFQERLIFYPGKLASDYRFSTGVFAEEVFIATADGEQVNSLYYHGSRPGVILYFHGNAGDLSGWQYVADDLLVTGYSLLIIDYRGYGKSSGAVSEKGFYLDAQAAYDFLVREKGHKQSDVIIYGRSIGTGVAVHLASLYPCKALILESPYVSLAKLANEKMPYFFPALFLRSKFNNAAKIKRVDVPLFIVHGGSDTLIPPEHSQKLFALAPNPVKRLVIANAGHNDLSAFEEYADFIAGLPELLR